MAKRQKTDYPGVYYVEVPRLGGPGMEKSYIISYRKDGKLYEERVGRQYKDQMTPYKAHRIRGDKIEGRKKPAQVEREEKKETPPTFSNLWEEYSENKTNYKGLKQDRSRFINYIKPVLGKKQPHEIRSLDIRRLRKKLHDEGKSKQTIKNTVELLMRLNNYAVTNKLSAGLDFSPWDKQDRIRNEVTEHLTANQVKKLLQVCDQDPNKDVARMVKLALFTGMRRGELFRLRWDNVDFQHGFIHLQDPKGGPDQKIPMNANARQVLEEQYEGRWKASDLVFPSPATGGVRTDVRKVVNRIKKKAGLPKKFRPLHGLRHSFATILASSGKTTIQEIQKLLAHKDPSMTQRYAHIVDEALRRATGVVDDAISQAINGE